MDNFREWLEDVEGRPVKKTATDMSTTVDYTPNNTSSAGGDQTIDHGSYGSGSNATDFVSQIARILTPVDPYLHDRRSDGKVQQSFSGSPQYTSPEEAKKLFKPDYEHKPDQIESFLKACAHHFVWLERDCSALLKGWMRFRSMLHASNEGVNPVLYQVNLLRLKDFEKHFPNVNDAVQKCKDTEKYAELIKAWNVFYGAWVKIMPTLKHYLVTFEKNSQRT